LLRNRYGQRWVAIAKKNIFSTRKYKLHRRGNTIETANTIEHTKDQRTYTQRQNALLSIPFLKEEGAVVAGKIFFFKITRTTDSFDDSKIFELTHKKYSTSHPYTFSPLNL
jgi:hypothetical protein